MTKFSNLIFDGNNLFWRATIKTLALQINPEEQQEIIYTKAISLAFNMIDNKLKDFGYDNSKVYILFDNNQSVINKRKEISGGQYKHSRESSKVPKQLYATLDLFHDLCKIYSDNFYTAYKVDLEADDLTQVISNSFPEKELNLFISADMDWARNINKNSHWHNWKEVVTPKVFFNKYKFHPIKDKICIYKAIHGDASDNIDNAIKNLPQKLLLEIVQHSDTLQDVYDYISDDRFPKQWTKKFIENKEQLITNWELVVFPVLDLTYGDIVEKSILNTPQLKRIYNIYNIPLEDRMIERKTSSMFGRKDATRTTNRKFNGN